MYRLYANVIEVFEANFYRRKAKIVDRTIFKCFSVFEHHIPIALHRDAPDCATSKPGTLQFRQSGFACHQAAYTCRIAEHLIERDGHEIGMPLAQVKAIRGDKGCTVYKYIPVPGMGFFNPL